MSLVFPSEVKISRSAEYIILVFLLIVAAWLRFQNLGTVGFHGDEDHTALAVQGVLETGYPVMPSGTLYLRGIPYTYLAAFSAFIVGFSELALRLPAVVASLLVIYIMYVLTKDLFGYRIAILATLMYTFSAWDIETARTARMYEMFLLFWLLSTLVFYRGFIKGVRKCRLLTPVLVYVTITIHSLGIFLLTLFLWPFLLKEYTVLRYRNFAVYMAVIVFMFLAQSRIESHSYKEWRQSAEIHTEAVPSGTRVFPESLATVERLIAAGGWKEGLVFSLVSLLCILAGLRLKKIEQHGPVSVFDWIIFVLLVGAVLTQQYGGAFWIFLFSLFLRKKGWKGVLEPVPVTFAVFVLSTCTLWAIWVFFDRTIEYPGESILVTAKEVIKALIHPSFVAGFLLFGRTFPVMSLVVALGLVLIFDRVSQDPRSNEFILLLGFLAPLIVMAVLGALPWKRHVYMIYPFFLLVYVWTILSITQLVTDQFRFVKRLHKKREALVFLMAAIVAVVVSNGHSPADAKMISEVRYGPNKGKTGYSDHKSAALFVKQQKRPGDRVILMDILPYVYMGQMDYLLRTRGILRGVQADTEIFIGSPIIRDVETLKKVVQPEREKNIWLITSRELIGVHRKSATREDLSEFLESNRSRVVYTAADGETQVYLWHLKDHGSQQLP